MIEIKQDIREYVVDNKAIRKFQVSIQNWYVNDGRSFPWRNINEPFNILVSEFLLQKTNVEKVESVYKKFMNYWPSVQSLSRARISSVSKVIKSLGLKYKAVRLKTTAKMLEENFNCEVPRKSDKLLKLPGVGKYIASAVECFAFNKQKAILDTNVIRIFNRVFDIKSKKSRPRNDSRLWNFAQTLVPVNKVKEYNWGLIDFGALVCKSKNPLCCKCILYSICIFYKKNKTQLKTNEREKS